MHTGVITIFFKDYGRFRVVEGGLLVQICPEA